MFTNHRFRRIATAFRRAWMSGLGGLALLAAEATPAAEPRAGDTGARKPVTLFVSKLGDQTDGRTWQKAFRTIQAAFDAVPDDHGGHQILVRPDTYVEIANVSGRVGDCRNEQRPKLPCCRSGFPA